LLVHVWPERRRHAIDFAGRPVVRTHACATRHELLRAMRCGQQGVTVDAAAFSAPWLGSILRCG
jgi:hypothetical protein